MYLLVTNFALRHVVITGCKKFKTRQVAFNSYPANVENMVSF